MLEPIFSDWIISKAFSVDPVFPNLFRYHYDMNVDAELAKQIHDRTQRWSCGENGDKSRFQSRLWHNNNWAYVQ